MCTHLYTIPSNVLYAPCFGRGHVSTKGGVSRLVFGSAAWVTQINRYTEINPLPWDGDHTKKRTVREFEVCFTRYPIELE